MARHQLDAGDVEPSHRALDGCFNILSQAAIAVEPGNGALHHPTARQENEALGRVGALDDLDGPVAEAFERPLNYLRSEWWSLSVSFQQACLGVY